MGAEPNFLLDCDSLFACEMPGLAATEILLRKTESTATQ
jgi:hypothetical protein